MSDYIFECENGKIYGCKPPHCLVCKHCTDILYDWNVPYLFLCDIGENNDNHDCKLFELEENAITVEEFEKSIGRA